MKLKLKTDELLKNYKFKRRKNESQFKYSGNWKAI